MVNLRVDHRDCIISMVNMECLRCALLRNILTKLSLLRILRIPFPTKSLLGMFDIISRRITVRTRIRCSLRL
jgi:hypothetical protein